MSHALTSTLETLKYWAGQKLLHSPFHPYYLKVTGKEVPPPTYAEWLAAEARDLDGKALSSDFPEGYRVVLPPGARLAPSAAFWFAQAVAESQADLIYADEDVEMGSFRQSPVFKPAWSPELFRHCDYLGGAYLIRNGFVLEDVESLKIQHIPRVLFHRAAPALYQAKVPALDPAADLVSIIICSRNPALAADCLAAIRSTTAYPHYEIILIDHRAGLSALAEKYGVQRLLYEEEFNFARMCNTGVRASNGRLLLFLNDDTVPLDPRWLGAMAAQAVRENAGPVGAFLTYPDGRIQHAGVYIGTSNGAGHPGRLSNGTPVWPWLTFTREQLAVTGACLMLRRQVFETVGYFDENFPVNYNDVDLCLKCWKAGFQPILEARARVEHRESTTRKTGVRYGERRRFLDRWASVIEASDPYLNPNLTDNELLLPDPEAFSRAHQCR